MSVQVYRGVYNNPYLPCTSVRSNPINIYIHVCENWEVNGYPPEYKIGGMNACISVP